MGGRARKGPTMAEPRAPIQASLGLLADSSGTSGIRQVWTEYLQRLLVSRAHQGWHRLAFEVGPSLPVTPPSERLAEPKTVLVSNPLFRGVLNRSRPHYYPLPIMHRNFGGSLARAPCPICL